MDYWKIKENNYIIILLEYYIVEHNNGMEPADLLVEGGYLRDIIYHLGEEEYIFLDMKCLEKAVSRVFSFLKEEKILDRIIFFNIQKGNEVYYYLEADLHGNIGSRNKRNFIYFSDESKEQFLKSDIEGAYQKQRSKILKEYTNTEITFLPSSGVYSNMSLDYKRMFENTKDFQFILSEMYCEMCCMKKNFDYLVAASKNAIALAAILGKRLGKPVIYFTNIGQKYVRHKSDDKVENHKEVDLKTKQCLMIFDVICLGTEARILNGVINTLGGDLIGAVGMVCVQEPKKIKEIDKDSILAKANCLTTARNMGLMYRIALTRKELEGDNDGN